MDENEISEQFDEIYKSKIEPKLARLEKKRIEFAKKYKPMLILAIIFFLASMAMVSMASSAPGNQYAYGTVTVTPENMYLPQCGVCFMVIAACFLGFYLKFANDFRKSLKPILLQPILSIFGRFEILQKEEISLEDIKKMGLFFHANFKQDDDIIKGSYKGIPITLIETELSHSSNKSTKIDFRGLILKIKFNKNFEGITIGDQTTINDFAKLIKNNPEKYPEMNSRYYLKYLNSPIFQSISDVSKFMKEHHLSEENGKICIKVVKNRVTKKLEQIILEDPEFNEKYAIFSDDQVESRYLLTPSFMERIKNIQSVFLTISTSFVFKDEYFYLFLNCPAISNYFEVGNVAERLLDKQKYLKTFKELVAIFSLLNYFKLDQKLGL